MTLPRFVAGGDVWRIALAICATLLLAACGDNRPADATGSGGPGSGPGTGNACSTPNQGCPCDHPGVSVACGMVTQNFGAYVECSEGARTCSAEGTWGDCVGDHVTTKSVPALHTSGFGAAQSCTASNPCDPYCNEVADLPAGLDGGPDLTVDDAGLSITGIISTTTIACTSLVISPTPQTLTVTTFSPVSPNTLNYTAQLLPAGCYSGPVPALWSIDRFDVATISSSGVLTLVTPVAGPIHITAYAGTLSATAVANVVVNVVDTSSATSGYTDASFTAGSPATDTNLTILYPYDNTVFPLGLLPPLIQWDNNAVAAAQVKVTLQYPASGPATFTWSQIQPEQRTVILDPPINTKTSSGPRSLIPAAVWSAFQNTASGNDAIFSVQRHVGGGSSGIRKAIARTMHFAPGQLKGTVFYQSYGTNYVQNYSGSYGRFGAATLAIRPGSTYPTVAAGYTSSDGPGCRVCHSAAANGSLLVTQEYPTDNKSHVVTNPGGSPVDTTIPTTYNSNDGRFSWPAVYPDGSFLFSNAGPGTFQGAGSYDAALYSLASATLGKTITSTGLPSGLKAATPSFSASGKKIAFNHYGSSVKISGQDADARSLAMMDFDVATNTFSNPRRLVNEPTAPCSSLHPTDPCTNVWPTFLPGDEGVVFEKEIFSDGRVAGAGHTDFAGTRSGCDGSGACSNDGTKGELWWVDTSASPTAYRLNQANGLDPTGTTSYLPTGANNHTAANEPILDYEPTMNPQDTGGYYWVVFTSRRLYGNMATINPWWSDPRYHDLTNSPTPKKLWVAAIKKNPVPGKDPSYPAFYLPGQELLAGNSRGFWVLDNCTAASTTKSAATACESNLDCCGGTASPPTAACVLDQPISNPATRHCLPINTAACLPDNAGPCTADAECCGFSTGSHCASAICQPAPPLLSYPPASFTRDYAVTCPSDSSVVWRFFEWQATLPAGTSIDFTAQTAGSVAGLATATPVVAVGTALPPSTTTWTSGPSTVDDALQAAGSKSQPFLRITMMLKPSANQSTTPTLTNWKQIYDCVPSQ